MLITRNLAILFLFILSVAFTPFHHGWADYDQENPIEFTGTIQELSYANPHAIIKIKGDIKGETRRLTVYLAPVSRMQTRGVTEEMVKKGAVVKLVAYHHKTTKDEMRAERIIVDDKKYELR